MLNQIEQQELEPVNEVSVKLDLKVAYDEKNRTFNVVKVDQACEEDKPLYVPVAKAAKIAGVAYATMSAWADRLADPIPHIRNGHKRLIRRSAIEEYAQKQEYSR